MAVVGLLMFGDGVRDEVTSNILRTDGYPNFLSVFIVICVAIIPLTKIPLKYIPLPFPISSHSSYHNGQANQLPTYSARPIVSTLEILLGLDVRAISPNSSLIGMNGFNRGLLKATIRIVCTVLFVVLAILVPDFDRIMSLLGSVACFTICIILPLAFHLKIFGNEIPRAERFGNWALIVVSSILAIVATGFNFVPKEKLGLA